MQCNCIKRYRYLLFIVQFLWVQWTRPFHPMSLGFCTRIPSQLHGEHTVQPGIAFWHTELINLQCYHCPNQYQCLLLWYDENVGWHLSDLRKVPTMIDLAGTRTFEHHVDNVLRCILHILETFSYNYVVNLRVVVEDKALYLSTACHLHRLHF